MRWREGVVRGETETELRPHLGEEISLLREMRALVRTLDGLLPEQGLFFEKSGSAHQVIEDCVWIAFRSPSRSPSQKDHPHPPLWPRWSQTSAGLPPGSEKLRNPPPHPRVAGRPVPMNSPKMGTTSSSAPGQPSPNPTRFGKRPATLRDTSAASNPKDKVSLALYTFVRL